MKLEIIYVVDMLKGQVQVQKNNVFVTIDVDYPACLATK